MSPHLVEIAAMDGRRLLVAVALSVPASHGGNAAHPVHLAILDPDDGEVGFAAIAETGLRDLRKFLSEAQDFLFVARHHGPHREIAWPQADPAAFLPEDEKPCDPSHVPIHYAGCHCHEARRDRRLKKLEAIVKAYEAVAPACGMKLDCGGPCWLPKGHDVATIPHLCGADDLEPGECPA